MKAMIMAAGRGERLRPLTDHTPKPLIKVNGIALIEYHIIKLAAAGIKDIVINLAWLGETIVNELGDGSRWGVNISYSWEKPHALETAGGIIKALPLLIEPDAINKDQETFLVINGDIYFDYDLNPLPTLTGDELAHLWLVPNPAHNPDGDFVLAEKTISPVFTNEKTSYTFSGIALYKAALFYQLKQSNADSTNKMVLKLGPKLKECAEKGVIKGCILNSFWIDVGTKERLEQVNTYLGANK
ncbi:N-acetylmuramate alpha-1-phosphate uridylyltransferase MurU [Thalassotalea piscium]|uniref:MurNAc alpha-1-phosphate uridylyltransferase n=1 Tax=Thalassotalea piscium TaxID=1230533 RepID=A0A7X0NDY2_9GAMM|nr:nucleotidyltransferase family protein [Thalassotalea piscium]MBB6541657.1 MurNAc alpha-1-phosphate uridylyltransferase [Thalassotalea piscium]